MYRAFRLQAAATPNQNWGTLNLTLYARTFMAMERRCNVCHFCFSWDHISQQCQWGVDTPLPCPLEDGFHIGFNGTHTLCSAARNMASVYSTPQVVSNYL